MFIQLKVFSTQFNSENSYLYIRISKWQQLVKNEKKIDENLDCYPGFGAPSKSIFTD